MRLLHVFPILSFVFGARASSLDSRAPAAHPLDARDLLDVCGPVNRELVVPNLHGGITYVGLIHTCLCLSDIPSFLETDPVGIQAVSIVGEQITSEILTGYIQEGAGFNSNCAFPDHSVPACVNGNPCGFACLDGYTPFPPLTPSTCGCPAPNVVCNGQCVAPGACPSSQVTLKRRWVGSGSCTEKGPGWAACGVYGGGARAWECVNTARDLESCGGCVLPLTPYSPIGKDCTALPGVADVSCLSGECVVRRCLSGYAPSRDGARCISIQAHISQPHGTVSEDGEDYLQAMRYGLEHPL